MNNKYTFQVSAGLNSILNKIMIIMKLITLFLIVGLMQVSASAYSQFLKVEFPQKSISVKDVLLTIEKHSDYKFLYRNDQMDANRMVEIISPSNSLENIMSQILKETNLGYKILENNLIVITPEQQKIFVKGVVKDLQGNTLPGVSVVVKGSNKVAITDINGGYSIQISDNDKILVFSFLGMKKQEILIGNQTVINVLMDSEASALDEVVVVGYGIQKKASLVSSITSVDMKKMKGLSSNLTSMLAGNIAGMISYQQSGEPGQDNAKFFIRGLGTFGAGKVDPLILIDGMESSPTNLARLQPDDISGFSVLKDATASAVYGARGANGVILVTTKTGVDGKTKLSFRAENSISSNTRHFNFADNVTYMKLANEAVLTRDPLENIPYDQNKIDHTAVDDNPLLYPSNNWIKQLIKDYTMNQHYNLNLSGGSKAVRYYLAGTYNVDNGVLKSSSLNSFDSNIKLRNYSVRSNVNLQLTPTTEAIVRIYGQFDDYQGPIGGGAGIFNSAVWSNPVMFPAIYPTSLSPYTTHPLFGNALLPGGTALYTNPYAQSVSGFSQYNASTLQAQLELNQNLDFLIPGLTARVMAYTQRYGYFDVSRQSNPFFYRAALNPNGTAMELYALNDGGPDSRGTVGTEYLSYSEGYKKVNSTFYVEAAANYTHTFNKVHTVTGMLVSIMKNYLDGNAGNLQASLPFRNQGVSGRFTYGYDNRYLIEGNFGYNGSERFASDHRWGFFPSIGGAWIVSNEPFFAPLKKSIDNLKIRATYGLVGNDQIGNASDRFFYMSNVNLNDAGRGAIFGKEYGFWRPGVSIQRYDNNLIGWEKSEQINFGFDLSLFGSLMIVADVFKQNRTNILMNRTYIPSTMGLSSAISSNSGKAESQGIDFSLDYHKSLNNKWWVQSKLNFTYATSKILVYDEPTYTANEPYRSAVGNYVSQMWGYVAERLFVDENEVLNSPKQNFGEYKGGDIKYRDINSDGQITTADIIPLGYPTTPEINYGYGFTIGHGGLEFSAFLQGSARSAFMINPQNIAPFISNGSSQNGMLKPIVDSYWSEDNRNSYAFWPRLSNRVIANNNQPSTWWMRDGSFLRLKMVELGYNFPASMLKKLGLGNARFYMNGTNLFVFSKFKMWDPEMGGNGMGYPVQRVFNIGLNLGL